jgi:predicted lipase
MIKEFDTLNNQETELMLRAPFLVCILIAGADGTIDKKEIKEAITVTQKNKKTIGILASYFRELSEDFEDKLKVTIQGYPYESTQRAPIIIGELAELNKIFPKLDKTFAKSFYEILIELAEKIASSSGGLLGIHAVGAEEAKYVRLSMIQKP